MKVVFIYWHQNTRKRRFIKAFKLSKISITLWNVAWKYCCKAYCSSYRIVKDKKKAYCSDCKTHITTRNLLVAVSRDGKVVYGLQISDHLLPFLIGFFGISLQAFIYRKTTRKCKLKMLRGFQFRQCRVQSIKIKLGRAIKQTGNEPGINQSGVLVDLNRRAL